MAGDGVRITQQRAQQLADVALAVYNAGGTAIHVPLESGHPLVSVLRAALEFDAKGDLEARMHAGRVGVGWGGVAMLAGSRPGRQPSQQTAIPARSAKSNRAACCPCKPRRALAARPLPCRSSGLLAAR